MLSGVTLHIPAGTTAAFVGGTGSGKTTLISLLPRLHEPPPGTVFLDGVDVREIPLATLRGAIGFVPQEPFLFSEASPRTSPSAARHRCTHDERRAGGRPILERPRVARLDKDVAEFRDGYGTVIGERGITLSGGQKQRTAIARALFIDPPVLVLDDALSAVDTYTEDEILGRLKEVMRERTAIIVAHRVSTVRHADQIFVLEAAASPSRARTRAGRAGRHLCVHVSQAAARRGARGELMAADQEEEVLGKAYDARLMRRLLRYLRPYWAQVLVALVAIVGASLLQLAQPYLMKIAIDEHIAPGNLAGLDRLALGFLQFWSAASRSNTCRRGRSRTPASGSCTTCGCRSTGTCSGSTCSISTRTRSAG